MRQVHHLEQGSPEWKAHRATPNQINGSEIAAIMGLSSYVSRAELVRRKATGIEPEYDAATLKRFADGHENEAKARPLAEAIIDDDLSPLVMTDTIDGLLLSVSLDGITQGYDTTFEHKSLNQALAASLDAGTLPDEYHPQCEAGLMVSGATRCLFMASKDGDPATARHYWYESRPELRPKIIAACKQFLEDVANYEHVEAATPVVAAPIESLPALAVTVSGSISLTHNLERFGQRLTAFVQDINTKPQTDQDFVNLDAAVKVLKEAENALDAAESNALAQTASIADMCNLVATYRKLARDNRLMFEKIVRQEKENRRAEIVTTALTEINGHIRKLNERIGGQWVQPMTSLRFTEAVKGLKSLDSMRDKVAGALAQAKIDANEIADRIEANAKAITVDGANYNYLVHDFGQVCTKAPEDFAAMMAVRIAAHKEAEAAKIAAAAVEVERKAGEARAAAAVEAERMAEAKRVADGARNAFKEAIKGDVLDANGPTPQAVIMQQSDMGQSLDCLAGKSVRAIESDAAMITEFLALQACSPADKKAMRATIEKWELYRVKMLAARGMAAAA